jgi:hypothetical protein
MKPLPLILAFLPLIAFSLLSRLLPSGDIGIAALVAAVIAAIAMVTIRPIWPPKIINACSLVLFAGLAVAGFTVGSGDDKWLATWTGAGVGIVIGLVVLVLLPVMPFTEQYARESTPQQYWSSPTFKRINLVLSAAWGAAIVGLGLSRVAAAAIDRSTTSHLPQLVLGTLVPIAIIIYMLKFTQSYPDRVTQHEGDAASQA